MEPFAVALIVFIAFFIHAVAGFGSALLAMPLLAASLGLRTASPLFALLGAAATAVILLRYRQSFQIRSVWRLVSASIIGIPLGVLILGEVDPGIALTVLGMVTGGYALYALLGPGLPHIERPGWAFGAGFASGLMSGAYNTGGPPLIIYGSARRWQQAEFKSNLQSIFLVNTVMLVVSHALVHHYTPTVWQLFLVALPAAGIGLLAGFALDRYVNPILFRKIVLILLLFLGLRLMFG
jgi:hypothetical protein